MRAADIGPGPIWPSRIETNIGPARSLTMEHVETLVAISGAKRPPGPRLDGPFAERMRLHELAHRVVEVMKKIPSGLAGNLDQGH